MSCAGGPDIVQDGLVLCLDAANPKSYSGSGTLWKDLSGFDRDFTVGGSSIFNSGGWINNNTTNNTATSVSSSLNIGDQISVSAWVRVYNHVNWANFVVNNWVGNGWLLYSSTIHWSFGCATAGSQFNASFAHNNSNKWTHLLGTYDGSFVRLYTDGIFRSSTARASSPFSIGQIRIGGAGTSGNYDISHICVYSRALGPTEVLQNYNAIKGRYNL